jgi:hypothetical protein
MNAIFYLQRNAVIETIFRLTSRIKMNAPQHEPILRRPSTQGLEMRLHIASLAPQRRLLARAERENLLVARAKEHAEEEKRLLG